MTYFIAITMEIFSGTTVMLMPTLIVMFLKKPL